MWSLSCQCLSAACLLLSTWRLYHPSWLCPVSVAVSGTQQPSDMILHFRVLLPLSFCEVTCLSLPFLVLFITGGTRINSVVLEFLCPFEEKWKLINDFSLINITILCPYQHDQRLMFKREEAESEADVCSNCWGTFKLSSHPWQLTHYQPQIYLVLPLALTEFIDQDLNPCCKSAPDE